jgi:hypothetical protein
MINSFQVENNEPHGRDQLWSRQILSNSCASSLGTDGIGKIKWKSTLYRRHAALMIRGGEGVLLTMLTSIVNTPGG